MLAAEVGSSYPEMDPCNMYAAVLFLVTSLGDHRHASGVMVIQ